MKEHQERLATRRWTALMVLSLLGWMLVPAWPHQTLGQQPSQEVPRNQQVTTPAAVLPDTQEGFYDIEQLERLFQIARESGFSEESVREITIEDEEGNIVNAWDYLQEIKRRRAMQDKADQEKLHRLYITVQDILADLRERESKDLSKLREETVFPE